MGTDLSLEWEEYTIGRDIFFLRTFAGSCVRLSPHDAVDYRMDCESCVSLALVYRQVWFDQDLKVQSVSASQRSIENLFLYE